MSMEDELLELEMARVLAETEAVLEQAKAIHVLKAIRELLERCVAVLKPPPDMTLSEWADEYRRLSPQQRAGLHPLEGGHHPLPVPRQGYQLPHPHRAKPPDDTTQPPKDQQQEG